MSAAKGRSIRTAQRRSRWANDKAAGIVWLAIALAGLGWGTGTVATRAALLAGVPPFLLLAARFTLATALVLIWLLVRGEIPRDRPVWRDGAVLGVVNMAMPTFFFTLSLQHLSAGIGGLLIALVPLGTAFWAHWLLDDEPLHTAKIVGMVVALGGVAVLLLSGDVGIPAIANLPLGVGLMLIGVTLAALGGTLTRRYAERHRVSDLALPQFLAGAMTAIVVAAFAGELLAGWGFGGDGWAALLYLATVSTVLPFLAFLGASRLASATTASLIGYVVPVIGVIGGVLILGETVTLSLVAGGVLILAGVLIVQRSERLRIAPIAR
jgi:drug/metabolite transporter (DMT)-like permease